MDRTIELTDNWIYFDGEKRNGGTAGFFRKTAVFPVAGASSFTLRRKIICPKQVNDTVTVFFTGEYEGMRLYAKNVLLSPVKDGEGKTVYDITPALKTGKTVLNAFFEKGRADGFFLSVKRNFSE